MINFPKKNQRELSAIAVKGMVNFSYPDVDLSPTHRIIWFIAKTSTSSISHTLPGLSGIGREGVFEKVKALGERPLADTITYQWYEPIAASGSPSRLFILSTQGFVICQMDLSRQPTEQIAKIYLLPAEWEKHVVSGWRYYSSNRELFDPGGARHNVEKLRALVSGENPLLACESLRTLLKNKSVSALWIRKAISSASKMRAEVFKGIAEVYER